MKNAEARQQILLEASSKFIPVWVVLQNIPQMLQHFSTSSLPDAVGELGITLLACGVLLPVAFAVMDGRLFAKSSQVEKQMARQVRYRVGVWRTFWIWLSVTTPFCLIQSLICLGLATWRHLSHPSPLIYAVLGIGVGFYAALLIVMYYGVGDLLAAPQTTASSEK